VKYNDNTKVLPTREKYTVVKFNLVIEKTFIKITASLTMDIKESILKD